MMLLDAVVVSAFAAFLFTGKRLADSRYDIR